MGRATRHMLEMERGTEEGWDTQQGTAERQTEKDERGKQREMHIRVLLAYDQKADDLVMGHIEVKIEQT